MKAETLLKQAESLQKHIDHKLANRLENTPKRSREAMSARIEGWRMQRVQKALRILADAVERGKLPSQFSLLKKSDLERIYTRKINHSGYYTMNETNEWYDTSELSCQFRGWVDGAKSAADVAQDQAAAHAKKLMEIKEKVKFAAINGFFPTPPALADRMARELDAGALHDVLEPSAGSGNLIDAVLRNAPGCSITGIEVNHTLANLLDSQYANEKRVTTFQHDFMDFNTVFMGATPNRLFDRIIMNPPFENLQDIDHIRHAAEMLDENGRLVAICSPGPFFRNDDKCLAFRDWLGQFTYTYEELPPGTFKESGTNVAAVLLIIDR